MEDEIKKAAKLLKESGHTTAFTGAGISVESGIPPFRGPEGLWAKYDPKVLEISWFQRNPADSWKAIKEIFYDFFGKVEPNSAHKAIAKLEEQGFIKAIITQNIDNLHQEAGSKNVFEYHGNYSNLVCPKCGERSSSTDIDLDLVPPRCKSDNAVLKPDFVFFGEQIPQMASEAAFNEAVIADVFLLVGTTGEVMPANLIPRMAKQNGATIIEINTDPSAYTSEVTDVFLQGRAGEVLPKILTEMGISPHFV